MQCINLLLVILLVITCPRVVAGTDEVYAKQKGSYVAAVYEHAVINPPERTRIPTRKEALGDMMKNLEIYKIQVEKAALSGADIIVFPEMGITGRGWDGRRDFIFPYLETIPDPSSTKWNPCTDQNNVINHKVQTYVSCLAKNNSIFVVVNYGDIQPCNRKQDPNCPDDEHYQYNTNIVFDRRGFLVARYHKQHLFFEFHFDTPSTPEIVTFDTEFGKFGTFTCFDILFKSPTINLTDEYRVGNIVFPTAWMDAFPLLAAIQFHSAFASGAGVNFLSANLHLPTQRFQGSGIYTPDGPADFYYNQTSLQGKLLVSRIPIVEHSRIRQKYPLIVDHYTPGQFQSDVFHDSFNFVLLNSSATNLTVCHETLCCVMEYSFMEPQPTVNEIYALGAFSGLHTYQGKYFLQICTLLKCANETYNSCGAPTENANTKFSHLSLSGNFSTKYVYPEILLSVDNSLKLDPNNGDYQNGRLVLTPGQIHPVLSFSLFGRIYSLDDTSGGKSFQCSGAPLFFLLVLACMVHLLDY